MKKWNELDKKGKAIRIALSVVTIGVTGTLIYLGIDKYRTWAMDHAKNKSTGGPAKADLDAIAEMIAAEDPETDLSAQTKRISTQLSNAKLTAAQFVRLHDLVFKKESDWSADDKVFWTGIFNGMK